MPLFLTALALGAPFGQPAQSWSAVTLDQGQVQLGTRSGVGVTDRVELGTATLADMVGIFNADLKAQLVATEPFDLAVIGGGGLFRPEGLSAWTLRAGGRMSVWTGPVSLHGSVVWHGAALDGTLENTWLATQPPLIWAVEAGAEFDDLDDKIDALRPSLALAWAATPSDTLLIEAEGFIWAWIDPIPGMELYGLHDLQGHKGTLPVRDTYVASVSLEHAWRYARLRFGLGTSAVPFAWLVQSFELSWRLGGGGPRG